MKELLTKIRKSIVLTWYYLFPAGPLKTYGIDARVIIHDIMEKPLSIGGKFKVKARTKEKAIEKLRVQLIACVQSSKIEMNEPVEIKEKGAKK